jgi:TolA-binding protein
MLGSSAAIKVVTILVIVLVSLGALWHITNLKADLAVSRENAKRMTEAVEQQQAVIQQIQEEQRQIRNINNELNTTIKLQNKDMDNLKDRFSQNAAGGSRDFGKTAAARPNSIERAVNRGTVNALRCLEIASGAPLTEAERNATTPDKINRECPSLANPNYKPAGNN